MMPIPEIQGDADFLAFQAKLATVSINAPALGKRIGADVVGGCCCPLGAHPDATSPLPPSTEAHKNGWSEVPAERLRAFIEGWHRSEDFDPGPGMNPYFLLGVAYRDQFTGARS
jgi:hypothetical protein